MFTYNATLDKVVDGDTVDLTIDLGLRCFTKARVRLNGINAQEHTTDAGRDATAFLAALLPVGTHLVVETHKDKTEKYGRWLADLYASGLGIAEDTINEHMVASGHARHWDGHGERP